MSSADVHSPAATRPSGRSTFTWRLRSSRCPASTGPSSFTSGWAGRSPPTRPRWTAAPGSAEGGLIVSDIDAARGDLTGGGIDASEIWHGPPFPAEARQPGSDPGRTSYGSFFSHPARAAPQ